MSLRFERFNFVCSIILFVMLAILATLGSKWGLIRSLGGDVLATMWIYYSLAAIVKAKPFMLTCISFLAGAGVELCQLLAVKADYQFESHLLRVVFGSTPDWWDLVAYAMGALICLGWNTRGHISYLKEKMHKSRRESQKL
ncbi:DUF2809 domain-containing protein [Buttiauxella sp. A2-C2_NF]|uniref:ribosomal maturation YjgA family protein n=1 Tax=Buttiauxella ferragutiae TaxID=82989 RepID=UPI001E40B23F|nr:DUF2809 domain-containing protein [Buttiauxella ferragutiae]MCE0824691.1 DUF2809 domain-containing protein [Buttiauxella ferragutiae]